MKNLKWQENYHLIILSIITVVFIVCAYIISVIKHEQFLSNGWDLGIYEQYMYKFAHFKKPVSTVYARFGEKGMFFLSDHITLLLPFESMFYWLLGNNTLLYLQIIYIVIGAIGLYKLTLLETSSKYLSLLAYFLVLSHYSVFAALDFDFHTNIIGSMLIPWIIYYLIKNKIKYFLIFTVLSLLSKEDAAIILISLSMFLFLSKPSHNNYYKYVSILFFISLGYFIFAYYLLKYLSPFESGEVSNWRYKHISDSLHGFFYQLIDNPGKYLSMAFDTVEKQMKLKYFLYTGGILGIFNPKYFLVVLPNFVMNNLSDSWGTWGNMGHYNIIFAIWVPYMIISFIYKIKNFISQKSFLQKIFIFMLSTIFIYSNIYFLRTPYLSNFTSFDKIFYSEYYHQRFNIKEIKEMLALIPKNASVSAYSHLIPHLAFRDKCYYFPEIYDAEYIALIESDCINRFYYFQNSTSCYLEINRYKNNDNYKVIYNKNYVLLLKKRKY